MNEILLLLFFLLLILVGGKRGFKLFLSLCLNFFVLMIVFYLIGLGLNAIIISLAGCLFISWIILYFVNGKSLKTSASMKSILIVLVFLTIMVFFITSISKIAGFGYESYEEINMFSYDIKLDFTNVSIAVVLIGLIGAMVDSSIAISSALYEVFENNKHLTQTELYHSGLTIGKDILGTTTNTLLFAFLGEFMTLLIWFQSGNYTLEQIINSKTFVAEFIKIMFSGLGCFLIIPVTSYITSKRIKKEGPVLIAREHMV